VEPVAQLLARWRSLPPAARVVAGGVLTLVLAIAIAAVTLGHGGRVALFAQPLHSEQLSEVQERLASWDVPFTPTADNIIVDARRRNDVLLRLSLAGLPHEHLAGMSETLSGIGVLTPQSVIDVQSRVGLAGDIEAGLRGIGGVDDARVILAPAKPAEFGDDSNREASASVRLRLRAGAQLSPSAIAGVRAFVAASVPALQPNRVTVVDDRGIALGEEPHSDDATDLQRSLQSALDTAYGDGVAVVRVRAEYDGSHTSERYVRRAPVGGDPITRTRRSETYDGEGKRYRHVDEGEDRGSETRELLSQRGPGSIKRLSTAVLIDETRAVDVAKVREIAAAAVGYDVRRGDTLVVEAVDFHRTAVARKDAWWLLYGAIVPLAPVMVLAAALVLCARFALVPLAALVQSLAERAMVERASKDAAAFAPGQVRTMLAEEPPHAAAAIISALPASTATAVLELYPSHERAAIIARMQRGHSPLLNDAAELLRTHV
jgi:flagellar biosynthesis/type III secretory pathway M-ring protein FliF/YscJ